MLDCVILLELLAQFGSRTRSTTAFTERCRQTGFLHFCNKILIGIDELRRAFLMMYNLRFIF